MKKGLIIFAILLVVVIGGGIYYFTANINPIVESAIERYGSQATQTTVSVEGVDISLREGRASIAGITVGNPAGFGAEDAFRLEDITVDMDLRATTRETLVFDEIAVREPEVFFEVNAEGRNNLAILKENLGIKPAEEPAAGPNLKIARLAFDDAALHGEVVPVDRSYDLKLPSFSMANLGGADGAGAGVIAREILARLLDQALAQVKQAGIDQVRERVNEEINTRGREILEQSGEELQEKAKGALEGLFN